MIQKELRRYLEEAESFFKQNLPDETEQILLSALVVYPDSISVLNKLAQLYLEEKKYNKFKEIFEKIRLSFPNHLTETHHMWLRQYIRETADWEYYDEEVTWFKNHLKAECIPFYAMGMALSEDEFLTLQRHYLHQQKFSTEPKLAIFNHTNRNFDNRKINIGFFSANWRNHAETFMIGELIENINRDKFNLFLYDIDPFQKDFQYKQRIIDASGGNYAVLNKMSDWEIANKINADKIDILIDFNAFTPHNRISVFTFQPAPIQASYLGYSGTLGGLQGIDFIIADKYLVPENHQQFYPEHIMYLNPCAYTYDMKCLYPNSQFSRKAFGLPQEAFILACFSESWKITPAYFDIWMHILAKVPNTILWLYFQNANFEENIKNEAKKHGIETNRIYFTYHQTHPEYMAKQRIADLFLDTQYCNARTLTLEALFMNLPVITCPGETWASRTGGSILTALEMPELIAKNPQEYEEKIIFYATHPTELAQLKEKLAFHKQNSPLFNSKNYAQRFENLCQNMIEIYEQEYHDKQP